MGLCCCFPSSAQQTTTTRGKSNFCCSASPLSPTLIVLQASCCIQKTRLSGGLSRMMCQAIACNTLQKRAPSVVVPPMPTQPQLNTGCHGVMLLTLPVLHQAPCLILKVTSYCCCNMHLMLCKATVTTISSSSAVAAANCVVHMHCVCLSDTRVMHS